VASYAWSFGDGQSGTGVSPSHAYAAGGARSVTLTVTDDLGASGSVTHVVSAVAPGGSAFVSDAFARTVRGGWGSADVGGAWSVVGAASQFSVDPGVASLVLARAGVQLEAVVGPARTDADVVAGFAADRVPVGGPLYVSVTGRRVSAGNAYLGKVLVNPGGAVTVRVARLVGGVETALAAPVTVAGLSYVAGMGLSVRVQVSGAAPSLVRARVWRTGQAEPAGWQVSASDASAGLQSAGSVGTVWYLSGATTNAPLKGTLTTFTAQPTG
jgi:PKD repeat protein